MCVLFLYFNDTPEPNKYRLIIASNRDEFWDRATKPLDYWDHDKNCMSGQDCHKENVGGSTWLGMSKTGKVGVLLNILGFNDIHKESRGHLVRNFLTSDLNCHLYIKLCVRPKKDLYNGFHLLLLDCSSKNTDVAYFNNKVDACNCEDIPQDNDYICLGNSVSGKTPWKKVARGKELFKNIIRDFNHKDKKAELRNELVSLLQDSTSFADDEILKKQAQNSHPDESSEDLDRHVHRLSSLFVKMPEQRYGTRTHSIITVDYEGHCEFLEKTLLTPVDEDNFQWKDTVFQFDIQS
ncbi:transport and Golgi organization 2 homolog [Saccostrea echinata]|uniref:transport and Golgi organization 2 homolog n=1 Tax=Saccostrea echinata TaxID=191078 RepID=UPI002A827105|nr:transport and Golgi organization 2 homolog [Saccostrea echinata]XP_061196250.1 transport and Golgi organization 2 homolog [Saccostrea echinata]